MLAADFSSICCGRIPPVAGIAVEFSLCAPNTLLDTYTLRGRIHFEAHIYLYLYLSGPFMYMYIYIYVYISLNLIFYSYLFYTERERVNWFYYVLLI